MDNKIMYLIGIMFILVGIICLCFCIGAKDVKADDNFITGTTTLHYKDSGYTWHFGEQQKTRCVLIDYPYMYCNDGYVYNRNNYKILHASQVNEWLQSSSDGVYANGFGWYLKLKDISFDW